MVKSNRMFSPQNYVELVTGKCYLFNEDNDIIEIERLLRQNGFGDLTNYPLSDIDIIVKNNLNVVLVECSLFIDDELVHKYHWFEVNKDSNVF